MARELVESKVDVIVAVSGLGAREAKQASRIIPIVVIIEPDPSAAVSSRVYRIPAVTSPASHLWQLTYPESVSDC